MDYQNIEKVLQSKKNELLSRVNKIDKDIHHRDEPVAADFAEQTTELENLEVLFALDKEGREELNQVNNALMRLENNEYELCSDCGNTIAEARLEAIPFTDQCIICAEKSERTA
jgi:RNA polymerase-binding transcription factor DksA